MPQTNLICGLDIGSSAIRIVLATPLESGGVHILGATEVPSEGISKGVVTSIEDTVASISKCLEETERVTGAPIEHAYIAINGSHLLAQESQGVVAVSRPNSEIKEDDVERAIEAAQAVATPPNYEILHVIPRSFKVDGQEGIKDPLGMTGIRLEVSAQIILGLSSQIKNLTKSIYRTGVDIDDLVVGLLACAESVLTRRQKELGVVLINLGAQTTGAMVFEEGDVLAMKILPLGGVHITNDIAIGLRTSLDVAERIKLEVGTALPSQVGKREEIALSDFDPRETSTFSKKYLAEIIEARLEEIFKLIDKELKKIGRSGRLPAGVVLTGGGAKLPGVVEVAKREFKLPSSLGTTPPLSVAIDKVYEPTFSTALGLVLWGLQISEHKRTFGLPSFKPFSSVKKVSQKFKEWFRNLIP